MSLCISDGIYKLYLKCVSGIERFLQNELISLGFRQNDLTISHSSISISNASIRHAYFLSYFSRFTKEIYLEIASFKSQNSSELLNSCRNVEWSKYINPSLTFMVKSDIANGLDNFKSNNYTSLVVKDAIKDYFTNKHELNIDLKNPDLKLMLTINSAYESNLYIDLIGSKLNNNTYRDHTSIQDMDSTLANSLLEDCHTPNSIISLAEYLNYSNLDNKNEFFERKRDDFIANYRKKSIIDTSCGIGTIPIESAMADSGIPPGSFINKFSSELLINSHENELKNLISYSKMIMKIKKTKSIPVAMGCEKNWEKINIAVNSANNAGVLKYVRFHMGSPLDTFKYIGSDCENPLFICRLPMTGIFIREIRDGKTPDLKKYQATFLKKIINSMRPINEAKMLLLIPNCFKKTDIESLIDNKLQGGRSIFYNGIHWACYNYKN